jgi:nucleoside-diphosphate-sugar epimerase
MNYTVIGGRGFIGSRIVELLKQNGASVWTPEKDDAELFTKELGIIIYCAGHGDCENGFLKVFESNLSLLVKVSELSSFDKLVYISSSRVYMGQADSNELSDLFILSHDSRRLFNLTKLVAEEILLKSKKNIIIVRPTNVYGLALDSPLFLPSIVRNAINNGKVDIYVSPDYAKDYVSVDDVAEAIYQLSVKNNLQSRIFNIASGQNIKASDILKVLVRETGCEVIWHSLVDNDDSFPITTIDCIDREVGFKPKSLLSELKLMISDYKNINE